MKGLKKIGEFCASMKLGVILILLLALGCAVGGIFPQGRTQDWYQQAYGERGAALIYGLSLDHVFQSGWFLVLAMLLSCNLLLCSLRRLPGTRLRWQALGDPEKLPQTPDCTVTVPDPAPIFRKLRMPKPKRGERDGKSLLFSAKNRLGVWGALVSHLGMLLLVIGFVFSQARMTEYTVYGVPGETRQVGETACQVTIDDFVIDRSASGAIEQYTTELTLTDTVSGKAGSGAASVNHPANLLDWRVYQNSTGPAATVTVRVGGEVQQEATLCAGEGIYVLNTPLQLFLEGYEPAYFELTDGTALPGYVYATYYMGEMAQAGVQIEGDTALQYDDIEIRFHDAQNYTLLQLKQDRFAWLAMLGGVILLAGMLLAFYLPPRRVWAIETGEGWQVCGASRKGKLLFAEQLREAAGFPDDGAPDEAAGSPGAGQEGG